MYRMLVLCFLSSQTGDKIVFTYHNPVGDPRRIEMCILMFGRCTWRLVYRVTRNKCTIHFMNTSSRPALCFENHTKTCNILLEWLPVAGSVPTPPIISLVTIDTFNQTHPRHPHLNTVYLSFVDLFSSISQILYRFTSRHVRLCHDFK